MQICKEVLEMRNMKNIRNSDVLLNLFKGDIIKTLQHLLFHLLKGLHTVSSTELKLCCTPVLLNEIQLAMILGVTVT